MQTLLAEVLRIQGIYYLATGLWPLISIRTFQMVTGPKHDLWLVNTVGVLVAVIGSALILGASDQSASISNILLAIGCAFGLAGIDVVYVVRQLIAPVYLWDAALQMVFVLLISFSSIAG
jgi:hypothetical protein